VQVLRGYSRGFPEEGVSNDSEVAECKSYADILGGSLKKEYQTTVRLSKTANFSTFARYFFRSFRDKANIIIFLFPRRLFTYPKIHVFCIPIYT